MAEDFRLIQSLSSTNSPGRISWYNTNNDRFKVLFRLANRSLQMDMSSILWLESDYIRIVEDMISSSLDADTSTSKSTNQFPYICFDPSIVPSTSTERRLLSTVLQQCGSQSKHTKFCAAVPVKVGNTVRALFCVYKSSVVTSFDEKKVALLTEIADLASELVPEKSSMHDILPALYTLVNALGHLQYPMLEAQAITRKVWMETIRIRAGHPPSSATLTEISSDTRYGKYTNITSLSQDFQRLHILPVHDFQTRMDTILSGVHQMQDMFRTMEEILEKIVTVTLLSSELVSFYACSDFVDRDELPVRLHTTLQDICAFFKISFVLPATPSFCAVDTTFPSHFICLYCSSMIWIAIYSVLLKYHGSYDQVSMSAQLHNCDFRNLAGFSAAETSYSPPNLRAKEPSPRTSDLSASSLTSASPRGISSVFVSKSDAQTDEAVLQIQLLLTSSSSSSSSFSSSVSSPSSPASSSSATSAPPEWNFCFTMMDMLSDLHVMYAEQPPQPPPCSLPTAAVSDTTTTTKTTKKKISTSRVCEISLVLPYARHRSLLSPSLRFRNTSSPRLYNTDTVYHKVFESNNMMDTNNNNHHDT